MVMKASWEGGVYARQSSHANWLQWITFFGENEGVWLKERPYLSALLSFNAPSISPLLMRGIFTAVMAENSELMAICCSRTPRSETGLRQGALLAPASCYGS